MSWTPSSANSALESDADSERYRPCEARSGIVLSRQGRMALVQVRESRGCAACTCANSQARGQPTSTRTVTVVNVVDAEVGRSSRHSRSRRALRHPLAGRAVRSSRHALDRTTSCRGSQHLARGQSRDDHRHWSGPVSCQSWLLWRGPLSKSSRNSCKTINSSLRFPDNLTSMPNTFLQ